MSEFGVAFAQILPGSSAGCHGLMDFEEQGDTAQQDGSSCVLLQDVAGSCSHRSDSRVIIPKKGKPEV